MSYTPFKMKGAPLHYGTQAHKSATKKVGDKPKDINKNDQIEEWEQARFDAIKENSPANYGSPVKEAKMASAVLPEVNVTAKKKKETGRKKIETSLANRNKGLTGYEITYSDGTKKKVLTK